MKTLPVILGAALAAASTSLVAAPAPARPNIVYMLADDIGYGDLGCYGQRDIATPNLDALARQGMRFTHHYAGNAVCTPSRSSLLTGMHPGHVRHRDNPRLVDGYGFLPEDTTFAEVMRAAGYRTGTSGKWHLGDRDDSTNMPHHHGFDFAYGLGYPYPAGKVEHWPSHVFLNGRLTPIPENANGARHRYMDTIYTDGALEFIDRNRGGPFILYLAFQGAHAPMDGAILPQYADRNWPELEKIYASMVTMVDQNVGRVLAQLERLGLAGNTVVLFTSDNGPHVEGGHDPQFFRSGGLLRGGKRDLYEGGVRVPLIARWPGVITPHSTSDHVSAFWDMLPTFAELAGTPSPGGIDGISLAPALRGQRQPAHDFLYWENQENNGQQAVLTGDWKIVRLNVMNDEAAPWELYNLASDPAELHDLAAAHPEIVARLALIAAREHRASTQAPLFPSEKALRAP